MKLSPEILAESSLEESVLSFAWSPDSRLLLVTPSCGDIALFSAEQPGALARIPGAGWSNAAASFGPAGEICVPGADGTVRIYPPGPPREGAAPARDIPLGRGAASALRWSPDGGHFAVAHRDALHVFDRSAAPIAIFTQEKGSVCDFAWNPAKPTQVGTAGNLGARFWELGGGEPFAAMRWDGASLLADWSPDGRWFATADQTPSVHLYDFPRSYPLHIQGYPTKVRSLRFSPDGRHLATASGPAIALWPCTGPEGPEGATPQMIEDHADLCRALAFSPCGEFLASGGDDGFFLIHGLRENAESAFYERFDSPVTAVSWSPDGAKIAAGTRQGDFCIYSAA